MKVTITKDADGYHFDGDGYTMNDLAMCQQLLDTVMDRVILGDHGKLHEYVEKRLRLLLDNTETTMTMEEYVELHQKVRSS